MKAVEEITEPSASTARANPDTLFWDQGLRTRMAAHGLSRREQEIALLALRGLSNREIADLLFICEQTVKDHLYTIFSKLAIHRRSQLATKLCGLASDSPAQQILLS